VVTENFAFFSSIFNKKQKLILNRKIYKKKLMKYLIGKKIITIFAFAKFFFLVLKTLFIYFDKKKIKKKYKKKVLQLIKFEKKNVIVKMRIIVYLFYLFVVTGKHYIKHFDHLIDVECFHLKFSFQKKNDI
jgi:hypothetical protein